MPIWQPRSSGTSGLVGIEQHAPAGGTTYSTTVTTEGTAEDVDATNLAVTFTAPSTGRVVVRLTGRTRNTTSSQVVYWGLRSGSSAVAGSFAPVPGTTTLQRMSHSFLIEGLTPGQSYTWKWAFYVSGGTGQILCDDAGASGPALMEVIAVPLA